MRVWVILIAVACLIFTSDWWMRAVFRRPFDETTWKATAGRRWRYVDDLISSRRLQGLTRKDVTDLLGEPKRRTNLTFVFGVKGLPIQDALRVRFDDSGRCVEARWDVDGC